MLSSGPSISITPSGPVDAHVHAPPSKSLTIRALVAAALASGRSALRRPLFSDDTYVAARSLTDLGIETARRGTSVIVEGKGGLIPASAATLQFGDAGTPLRLMTAVCCLGHGRFLVDGSARMRVRPLTHLLEALQSLGVMITSVNGDGCPPVEILAAGLPGGQVRLRGQVSSQYLSALLMAGPYGARDIEIEVEGDLVSRPYVDLTIQVMEEFGARVDRDEYRSFRVSSGQVYQPRVYPVEADASSASYLFAAAAVTGGRVSVTGIPSSSRQGDLKFLDLLESMGCSVSWSDAAIQVEGGRLVGIDADLGDMPDVAPTLAAVALFAEGPTTMRRIGHLRVKESDRVEGIAACLRALGAAAEVGRDSLIVKPPAGGRSVLRGCDIDPLDDHRLAMACAVAGLVIPDVRILRPACVSKSFPGFFDHLRALSPR